MFYSTLFINCYAVSLKEMVRMNPKPVEASGALVRFDICLFVPLIQKEGWGFF